MTRERWYSPGQGITIWQLLQIQREQRAPAIHASHSSQQASPAALSPVGIPGPDVLQKLQASDRTHAVVIALRRGMLD
jgi:hypothetical protein